MNKINRSEKPERPLKTLRESFGLTQSKLAESIGTHYRSIADWEAGRALPRADKFLALCKVLKVSPKELAKTMNIDVTEVPDDKPNHTV